MATPTIDEVFNDLVAVNQIVVSSLSELGKVRGKDNPLSDGDLRKIILTTSRVILSRLPCLRLGDPAICAKHSEYFHLLAEKMGAA